MRVIHVDAVQAHAVPTHVYEPRGPFGPRPQPEIVDIPYDPDKFPAGSTAQNGMQAVLMYECQNCMAILRESELDEHLCEGEI